MLRQSIVLASTLFVVWGMGVAMLALNPYANPTAGLANGDGPRYLVNTRTSSVYQDPTGRFTVYARTALRDDSDVREVERF